MNITNFNYQRNGVAGDGFYSFFTNTLPNVKQKSKYLVTFCNNEEEGIIISSCRVVDLNNPLHCWRGDEIAFAICRLFVDSGYTSLYQWKESFKK